MKLQLVKVEIEDNFSPFDKNFIWNNNLIKYRIKIFLKPKSEIKKLITNVESSADYLAKIGSTSFIHENILFKKTPFGLYYLEIRKNEAKIYFTNKKFYEIMELGKLAENIALNYLLKENIGILHASSVYNERKNKVLAFIAWMETGKTYTATQLYKKYGFIKYFSEDRLFFDSRYIYPYPFYLKSKRVKISDSSELLLSKLPFFMKKFLYRRLYHIWVPEFYSKFVDESDVELYLFIKRMVVSEKRNFENQLDIKEIKGEKILDKIYLSIYHEINPLYHPHIRQLLYVNDKLFGVSPYKLQKKFYELIERFVKEKNITVVESNKSSAFANCIQLI